MPHGSQCDWRNHSRNFRPGKSVRFAVFCSNDYRIVWTIVFESWTQRKAVERILPQSSSNLRDKFLFQCGVHLCGILDVFLWLGQCVLELRCCAIPLASNYAILFRRANTVYVGFTNCLS